MAAYAEADEILNHVRVQIRIVRPERDQMVDLHIAVPILRPGPAAQHAPVSIPTTGQLALGDPIRPVVATVAASPARMLRPHQMGERTMLAGEGAVFAAEETMLVSDRVGTRIARPALATGQRHTVVWLALRELPGIVRVFFPTCPGAVDIPSRGVDVFLRAASLTKDEVCHRMKQL